MDEVRIDQWSRSELTNGLGPICPKGPNWPRSELSTEKVRIDQGPNRPRSELSDDCTWTIRTLVDLDLVNSDLILFSFGQFGPRKVRSELTKFRSELTKGRMDLRSELTNTWMELWSELTNVCMHLWSELSKHFHNNRGGSKSISILCLFS